ncbi:iolG [Mytilus edulis]|uniref:IolG n=1 Tax=Mytilus edulis TaxID=6550 RepID=A0A8S3V0P9_MYTED|nr:iolG [Mytilus edulis]
MLSPRATVNWIIRNKLEDAEKFVKDYNLSAKCTTPDKLEAVYNDPNVKAVLICSPTTTHEAIIKDSLNANKAVFCEKPITDNIKTTEDCYNVAASKNKPLFNALHRRFDPDFYQVYSQIQEKKLGNLRLIKTTSRDLEAPPISYIKTSAGILNDSTIHDLDLSLWLSGSIQRQYMYKEMLLIQRLALFDNGMLKVENPNTSLLTTCTGNTTLNGPIHPHFTTRYTQAYNNELEHFLDIMEGKCKMRVTKEDTIKVMKLVKACLKSVQTQGPVIIPFSNFVADHHGRVELARNNNDVEHENMGNDNDTENNGNENVTETLENEMEEDQLNSRQQDMRNDGTKMFTREEWLSSSQIRSLFANFVRLGAETSLKSEDTAVIENVLEVIDSLEYHNNMTELATDVVQQFL